MSAPEFDDVVIGSGFGGSVSACRLAQAGRKVLVLERGRRWTPDTYPRDEDDAWIWNQEQAHRLNGWADVRTFDNMWVVAGAGVTREFYDVLLERHPDLRSMFPEDLDHQSEVLRAAFTAVLGHLDDSDWLTTWLGALGARHAEWGVTPAMYDAFCDCMVTAMATQADDRWTVEEEHLWQGILEDISRIMLAGAAADG